MSVSVRWSSKAEKDLKKLDPEVAKRTVEAINRFTEEGHGDVKRLKNTYPPEYRLRVGDWRVRFVREPETGELGITRIRHRSKAYDRF